MTDEPAPPAGAQAVVRALRVLHSFRDHGPQMGVSDIARALDLRVSTAHRLCRTLVAEGFLEQDRYSAKYRLGASLAELGHALYHHRGLHRVEPLMRSLGTVTGASPGLAVRNADHVIIVMGETVDPSRGTALRIPVHASAMGKVLLAWEPDLDPLGADGLAALTPRTITDPAELAAELARVREQGHALNDEELVAGKRTVAVPLTDEFGRVHMALSLRANTADLPLERVPEVAAIAKEYAPAIRRVLLHTAE